jgi:predicted dehydrogenase
LAAIDGPTGPGPVNGQRAPYRGALIGFGGVARGAHLPGFRHDAAVRARLDVVAAVDPAPSASEGAEVPVLTDRDALATIGQLDFVDICTPTATHLATTLWALEHGFHVLCEKPVAVTREGARRIATAAQRARRVVMPCHQYRFNPAWRQMLTWLREDAIGHWHLAELSVYRPAADAGADPRGQPWRTLAIEGGGILLDHGTHLLYSLLDAAGGEATAVRAWTGRLRHLDYGAEDTAQVVLEFPGRLATLMLTWAASHRETRVRFIGQRGTIDWQGGVLRLDRVGHAPESHDFTVQLDKRSYAGWFAALFTTFADAMDRGTDSAAMEDIARVGCLLEAASIAARTGSCVPIG